MVKIMLTPLKIILLAIHKGHAVFCCYKNVQKKVQKFFAQE